jgi:YD repeat-containing protein
LVIAHPICPNGFALSGDGSLPLPERYRCQVQSNAQIPEKNPKACTAEGLIGNPVNISLKAKYHSETDYRSGVDSRLQFSRFYSSSGLARRIPSIGKNWWHSYDRHIALAINSTTQTAYVDRHDGRTFLFTLQNGVWAPDSDVKDQLTRLLDGQGNPAGWKYFNFSKNEEEEYDVTGGLIKITDQNGQHQTLIYSDSSTPTSIAAAPGLLIKVTNNFGRELNFTYNSNGNIITMMDADGGAYSYGYDYNHRLISITWPDAAVRQYHYENTQSNCINALTGITDERGIRFATYAYDSQCRATSTQHADGVNSHTVTYGSNTATVQDPLGISRTYNFTTVLGVTKNTSISQPCATCGGSAAQARTYDANGNVSQKTDFNGNITQYQYNSRNLETSRTEAYGTASARTITTAWHSTLTLPALITEPGRTTAFTYDSSGNKLTETITDTATSATQTTTWTYNTDGQVLTIDGSRTDVSDVTEYTYDADGNLASIEDALGHLTEFTSYDDRASASADAHSRPWDLGCRHYLV